MTVRLRPDAITEGVLQLEAASIVEDLISIVLANHVDYIA